MKKYSKNELQIIFDGITEYMIVVDSDKYINNFCKDCNSCLVDETLLNQKNIIREIMVGNQIANYAKDSVEYFITRGIINGDGENINPTAYTKRAEVVVMLYKLLKSFL